MTDDEIRVAIAEALGWKWEVRKMYAGVKNVEGWGLNAHLELGHPDRAFTTWRGSFPDYLNSLDAMHAVEETLTTGEQRSDYQLALADIAITDDNRAGEWFLVHATARQRAEAFLRVIRSRVSR